MVTSLVRHATRRQVQLPERAVALKPSRYHLHTSIPERDVPAQIEHPQRVCPAQGRGKPPPSLLPYAAGAQTQHLERGVVAEGEGELPRPLVAQVVVLVQNELLQWTAGRHEASRDGGRPVRVDAIGVKVDGGERT